MKILAVDNDTNSLEKLCRYLEALFPGNTIIPFVDPMAAAQYMHHNPYSVDCIFSALLMRPIDGLQLIRHLYKTSPRANAYIIAETDTWELRALAWSGGAVGYMQKPITPESLKTATAEIFCKKI